MLILRVLLPHVRYKSISVRIEALKILASLREHILGYGLGTVGNQLKVARGRQA